jgi:hypothetical protein
MSEIFGDPRCAPAVSLRTERTIAVELELVRPARSFGQLRNRQGEHRLDEPDLAFAMPVVLHPLTFEDALKRMLKTPPVNPVQRKKKLKRKQSKS